jgi:hypothetical protein
LRNLPRFVFGIERELEHQRGHVRFVGCLVEREREHGGFAGRRDRGHVVLRERPDDELRALGNARVDKRSSRPSPRSRKR